MSDFQDFIDSLNKDIRTLAKVTLRQYWKDAEIDAKDFIDRAEDDLKRWTKLLAKGELSRDDFEWLVRGKKSLAKLKLLRQDGLAKIRLNQFKNNLINLIVDTAFAIFL